ncbi:MAG TPA: metal-dependent hydrolase [Pyrinomonadaceae bacterium]|nr:metal-dependent hydrolase [Pyrinomonadaceae bacterium]
MDNLTHSLVGLTAAKAGLEKLSPGATTLCLLAANAPDVDVAVLVFRGRWSYLHHHRGITHSIVGTLVLAIALPIVFYLAALLVARFRQRDSQVRFKGLLLASVVTTATHPILDWTNNYGMRFLLPWNSKWFYGDFLFVIDPFFWIVLGGSAFLLTAKTRKQVSVWLLIGSLATVVVMVGSAGRNMTAGANVFRVLWLVALATVAGLYRARIGPRLGGRVAIAGFAIVIIYSAALAITHVFALRDANLQAAGIAAGRAEQVLRVAAMPTLANPTEWLSILETDRATYKFQTSLLHDVSSDSVARFEKPIGKTAELIGKAERDSRAQIFLGFARFPGFRVVGEDCLTQTIVQFADLRYTEPGKGRGTFSLDLPVDCPVLERSDK